MWFLNRFDSWAYLFHPVTPGQLIETIVQWGYSNGIYRVHHVNVHAMNLAHDDAEFRDCLARAALVFCDGYGVKWGAQLVGVSIPARLTPPDWIEPFAEACGRAGQPVFALGDENGVAESFQSTLKRACPGYLAAGSHNGFFEKRGPENEAVIDEINQSGAVHLLVGFGMPLQEKWALANAYRLRTRTIISVGALFRWYAGVESRIPRFMTDHGFEWMGRLARHPVRHFRRYIVGNARFLMHLARSR